jgi:hypothetical protein
VPAHGLPAFQVIVSVSRRTSAAALNCRPPPIEIGGDPSVCWAPNQRTQAVPITRYRRVRGKRRACASIAQGSPALRDQRVHPALLPPTPSRGGSAGRTRPPLAGAHRACGRNQAELSPTLGRMNRSSSHNCHGSAVKPRSRATAIPHGPRLSAREAPSRKRPGYSRPPRAKTQRACLPSLPGWLRRGGPVVAGPLAVWLRFVVQVVGGCQSS